MVIINAKTVKREVDARGWDDCRLASEMGVSYQRVRTMLAGEHCGPKVQSGLFSAFDGHVSMDMLFTVTAGEVDHEREGVVA